MNLPNKLTIARVIAVPFFIAAYLLNYFIAAFLIFVVASLTDMLDGKIARKYSLVTNFGKIMDPPGRQNSGIFRFLSDDSTAGSRMDADYYPGERAYGCRHENSSSVRRYRYCSRNER